MPTPHLFFRPMRLVDLDTVMGIENDVYQFPWSEGVFRDCIRAGYHCWLAQMKGEVVAHAVLTVGAGESHILNISVSNQHQRQGIGSAFVKHLIQQARKLNAEVIMLEVRATNQAAINLYNCNGFNEIGSRKAYYPAPEGKEDALLFALQL